MSQQISDKFKQIVDSANEKRLSIKNFAIEIWKNAVLRDIHYLGFASLLLESVTGLQGEVCLLHRRDDSSNLGR